MLKIVNLNLGILLYLFVVGCATQGPHRLVSDVCQIQSTLENKCNQYSIVSAKNAFDTYFRNVNYLLGIIEFDDQGQMLKQSQLTNFMDLLKEESKQQDLAIVTYVHGWKHNASPNDTDLNNFRDLLAILHRVEQTRPDIKDAKRKRKVVGVYLAWPGSSLKLPLPTVLLSESLENLTFWGRKAAAHRIARGEIGQVFDQIEALQDINHNENELLHGCRRNMRLITVGHSFGGLIVHDALEPLIRMQANKRYSLGENIVEPYGDLVLLINPAFEAIRYQNIQHLVANGSNYRLDQQPVYTIFASQADSATKTAFPIGRWIATRFQRAKTTEQAGDIWSAVGHMDRLYTHTLALGPRDPDAAPEEVFLGTGPAAGEAWIDRDGLEKKRYKEFEYKYNVDGRRKSNWERSFTAGARLRHLQFSSLNPFWLVSVSGDIVPGHSNIWTRQFLGFMRQLYSEVVRPSEKPCGVGGKES